MILRTCSFAVQEECFVNCAFSSFGPVSVLSVPFVNCAFSSFGPLSVLSVLFRSLL